MDLVPVEKEKVPAAKKKIIYRSTMNPSEISDKPGRDTMGMEMEPFEVDESGETSTLLDHATVRISPERQQMIGLKTDTARKQMIHKLVKTVGRVDYAEPNVALVNVKFEGWAEKLYADRTGQMVSRGEPLLEIYSPELVAVQQEYLIAFRAGKAFPGEKGLSEGSALWKSAREKLALWDISEKQVAELERTGNVRKTLTIFSPRGGFILEKNVLQGQKVMAGEALYKIADLSRVWVYGEVYEYELPLVQKGQEAVVTLPYFPGEAFQGRVDYIYPFIDRETRTNRIRIELRNPSFKLKPEMYGNIELHAVYGKKLAIPEDAVLRGGEKNIVFIDLGDGYLEPREVKLGVRGDGICEVLEGLAEGERVVTSANFLVDSESSMKAALKQMTKSPTK
jgi:Cu(I)/Ag(I) efflux system membrane fusion protein/cobalt-zinc-cadmium efflux system membrane fusion protein